MIDDQPIEHAVNAIEHSRGIGSLAPRRPVSMGRLGLAIDKEPVLQPGIPQDLAHYADPMPQALTLTAIVIGFAMTALFLVVLLASRGMAGTDHVDGTRAKDH